MILQCYVHKTAEYKFNTQSGRIPGGFSNLPAGGWPVAIPGDSRPFRKGWQPYLQGLPTLPDCFGLLLPSPQDSTTSTLPGQGRSTKTRYQLLCCRGSFIAMSHSSDYLRLHWLLSSESSTPLLASLPISDLATMSAMFCEIYIGSQSVSEYHKRYVS